MNSRLQEALVHGLHHGVLTNQLFLFPIKLRSCYLVSKTLIDNIFINSIDYTSTSGNLTIQLADHLFQFVILEGFFKELVVRKINLKEGISNILMRENLLKP